MYRQSTDLLIKLLDGADNIVRRALVNTIKKMPDGTAKSKWINIVSDGADQYIKAMLAE